MSTSTRRATVAASSRTHLRLAGWGALAAALSYSLQPILVMTIWAAPAGESLSDSYPAPADISPFPGEGIYAILAFTVTGLGIILLAMGIHRVSRERLGAREPWTSLTLLLGVMAGVAWLLAAAISRTVYSSVTSGLTEIGADTLAQKTALQTINIVLAAVLVFSSMSFTGWLLGMTRRARQAGIFGTAVAVFCYLIAVLGFVSAVVMGSFVGLVAIIPLLYVLGFVLIRNSGKSVELQGVPVG